MRKAGDLWAVLAVLAVYMAIAGALRSLVPLRSVEDWYRTFVWMSLPRATGLAALLYLDRRWWRRTPFSFAGTAWPAATGHAAAMLGLWLIFLTQSQGAPWGGSERIVGVLGSLLVGAFEEYLFRGVLLDALRARMASVRAVLLSSVLFTVYHVRPEAVAAWPHIFLTGVVFANLRVRGMGLAHLALIHWLIDSAFFFTGMESVREYGTAYWIFLAGLYLYAVLTRPRAPQVDASGNCC